MMTLRATAIAGCWELSPTVMRDHRGHFVKVFRHDWFAQHGLATDFREEYYSVSQRNVLRGLHFQTPPHDHVKLVYCTQGEVQDMVVDLRVGSPTYAMAMAVPLSADKGNALYIPQGLAHGFCVLSESATMTYKVSTEYAPEHDCGILWSSVDAPWAVTQPILSERDLCFAPLATFVSPFRLEAGHAA